MDSTLHETAVERSGSQKVPDRASPFHGSAETLFPDVPLVLKPPRSVRATFAQLIYSLCAGDMKRLAHRIFKHERERQEATKPPARRKTSADIEGDPEVDRVSLMRILSGKEGRRFDVEWLDQVAAEYGSAGEEAIVAFVCERYGFQMPIRKLDPQREAEQLARVERGIEEAAGALAALTKQLEEVRRAKERR